MTVLNRSFPRRPLRVRHRPQLRRALRALQRLLATPDETQHAFEVAYALDGDVCDSDLREMLSFRAGRQLFANRPQLLDWLADRERLSAMPEGSFGRAYLDHIDRYGLDPGKLVELRRETDEQHAHRTEAERWFVERVDLQHDLFHVLSGYGADGLGEGVLLLFSNAQYFRLSRLFLATGAALRSWRLVGPSWFVYLWRGWRRGRRAACLLALPYEELLPLPLDAVRRAVGIDPPRKSHPGGVLEMRPDGAVIVRTA